MQQHLRSGEGCVCVWSNHLQNRIASPIACVHVRVHAHVHVRVHAHVHVRVHAHVHVH